MRALFSITLVGLLASAYTKRPKPWDHGPEYPDALAMDCRVSITRDRDAPVPAVR